MENQKAKVVIYTKDPCPYCVRAISFFDEQGIKYEEHDLTGNQAEMDKIKNETGWRTMPIIKINNEIIGGYSDMKSLHDEGKLEGLLTK
ncbi:MAG: glutathione S-transferase N-terminal domain-containing protein [Bdellovibrionaceae bacterium]|nr:glutathione S-transferase N-terminal domain-containing protein [Pseudobdellovibrionaceae bacterium]